MFGTTHERTGVTCLATLVRQRSSNETVHVDLNLLGDIVWFLLCGFLFEKQKLVLLSITRDLEAILQRRCLLAFGATIVQWYAGHLVSFLIPTPKQFGCHGPYCS